MFFDSLSHMPFCLKKFDLLHLNQWAGMSFILVLMKRSFCAHTSPRLWEDKRLKAKYLLPGLIPPLIILWSRGQNKFLVGLGIDCFGIVGV